MRLIQNTKEILMSSTSCVISTYHNCGAVRCVTEALFTINGALRCVSWGLAPASSRACMHLSSILLRFRFCSSTCPPRVPTERCNGLGFGLGNARLRWLGEQVRLAVQVAGSVR